MEVLAWIGGLVVLYFVVTFALHMYRMRTDSYYRYKAREAEADYTVQQKLRTLSRSENPEIRELAAKLGRIEK